jgi:hypothetical protein
MIGIELEKEKRKMLNTFTHLKLFSKVVDEPSSKQEFRHPFIL